MRYVIGGKRYVQNKLSWGQVLHVVGLLRGADLRQAGGIFGVIEALGPKLPELLAVALVPEGQSPERTPEELAETAAALAANPEVMFEALSDFFVCNPVVSLAEKMTGTIQTITAALKPTSPPPSSRPSASSPTATSPNAAPSSGEAPRKNARRT
jgi:hypothetical protein